MSALNRAVLTGGSGFIGTHLKNALQRQGYEVFQLTRPGSMNAGLEEKDLHQIEVDLSEQKNLEAVLRELQPDILVHLASRAEPGRDLALLPRFYQDTVETAIHVALSVPLSTRLAVFIGSCEEYGNGPVPFRENQKLEAFSPYGWSKISAHYGVEMVARQRGLAWTWLRPFLTFGPKQKKQALIPYLIDRLLEGCEVALTAGEQTRDFVYIEDLCSMILRVLEQPDKSIGKTFNLCSGVPRRVCDVAKIIHAQVGRGKLKLGAIPYREREAMNFYGSPGLFNETFGLHQPVPFEEAISKTIAAYRGANE